MAKRVHNSQIDLEEFLDRLPPIVLGPSLRTAYDGLSDLRSEEFSIIFPLPSEEEFSALQQFAEEADINFIVKRMETGQFDDFHARVEAGHYFDLTKLPDYNDAMQKVAVANSLFEEIPAHIRKEFDNDPAKFINFIDKGDRAEFERLGLVAPKSNVEVPEPVPAPTPPENPKGAPDA